MRVRNRFLQLECDRLDIRRAVPAIEHLRVHRLRIAPGQRIFRFRQRAYIDAADRTRLCQEFLAPSQSVQQPDRLPRCRSTECRRREACPSTSIAVACFLSQLRCEAFSEQDIVGGIGGPLPRHLPPRMRDAYTGLEIILAKSKWLGKVGAKNRHILAIVKLRSSPEASERNQRCCGARMFHEFWADRPR